MDLPYGDSMIEFDVSPERLLGILDPRVVPGVEDTRKTILNALRNPVDGCGLSSAVKRDGNAVIVADDYTRPTPAGPICWAIADELNLLGIDDSCITILAGGGLHRPMSNEELRDKFGKDLVDRLNVVSHTAWEESQLEYLGRTSRGTPVWVSRRVSEADLRITVGMITAHMISGYAAGPKTILPGVSGCRTIFHNHGVIAVSPSARIGVRRGNPCWEDMVETIGFLDPTLAVNVVLNTRNELVAAFHGKPVSAQEAGLEMYHSIYAFRPEKKADIVVASANPICSYLDQCLKTFIHSSMLVREGGARIVASPCKERLGPEFLRDLYYSSLAPKWPTAEEYAGMIRTGAIKDIGDAAGILKFLQTNNSSLMLVSDASFDQDLTGLGFSHSRTVQDALDEATARLGANSKVFVMPYGAVTHPMPE